MAKSFQTFLTLSSGTRSVRRRLDTLQAATCRRRKPRSCCRWWWCCCSSLLHPETPCCPSGRSRLTSELETVLGSHPGSLGHRSAPPPEGQDPPWRRLPIYIYCFLTLKHLVLRKGSGPTELRGLRSTRTPPEQQADWGSAARCHVLRL